MSLGQVLAAQVLVAHPKQTFEVACHLLPALVSFAFMWDLGFSYFAMGFFAAFQLLEMGIYGFHHWQLQLQNEPKGPVLDSAVATEFEMGPDSPSEIEANRLAELADNVEHHEAKPRVKLSRESLSSPYKRPSKRVYKKAMVRHKEKLTLGLVTPEQYKALKRQEMLKHEAKLKQYKIQAWEQQLEVGLITRERFELLTASLGDDGLDHSCDEGDSNSRHGDGTGDHDPSLGRSNASLGSGVFYV